MLECFKQSNDMKPPVGPECLILESLQILLSRDSTILVGKVNFIVSLLLSLGVTLFKLKIGSEFAIHGILSYFDTSESNVLKKTRKQGAINIISIK